MPSGSVGAFWPVPVDCAQTSTGISASRQALTKAKATTRRTAPSLGASAMRSVTGKPGADCRSYFLGMSIPSLEKDVAEVGSVNLPMTHRAGLILRRLIVDRSDWPPNREGMALQAHHVHQAHLEKPGTGRPMRGMATAATIGFHRHMLVDERPLLVDVALVTNRISAGQSSDLPHCRRSMRVVAVIALHEPFVHPMVIRLREIRLRGLMAPVANLRFALSQQELLFLCE